MAKKRRKKSVSFDVAYRYVALAPINAVVVIAPVHPDAVAVADVVAAAHLVVGVRVVVVGAAVGRLGGVRALGELVLGELLLAHVARGRAVARLAEELEAAGYDVMNEVKWSHPHDEAVWVAVRDAFAEHFPMLRDAA